MRFRRLLPALSVLLTASTLQAQQADSAAAEAAPDSLDAEVQYRRALKAWDAGKLDEADSLLRLAVLIEPHYAEANLALGYLPLERYPKLREWEEKDRVPDNLASVVEESDRRIRLAVLVDPFVGSGRSPFVFLPAWAMKNFTPKEREKLPTWFFYWRGLRFARGSDYATALGDLREVLDRLGHASERTPTNALLPLVANEIRYIMAVIELKAGRTVDARKQFEQVLAQDLGMYMAHVKLAELHERNGAWNAALRERQRAVETNPDDPALLFDLATGLARANRFAEADSAVSRAIALNPHNPGYVYLAARVRLETADSARALQGFQKFLTMAPASLKSERNEAQSTLDRLAPVAR